MTQFELVVDRAGVSDLVKYLELQHWFCGLAGQVCDLYKGHKDPKAALSEAKAHLRTDFGRQSHSAQKMLSDLLGGKPIKGNDAMELKRFIIALKGIHIKATETGRQNAFDSQDIIANVLEKVGFLKGKWAEHNYKRKERWDSTNGEAPPDATFNDLLSFLNRQNLVAMERAAYETAKPTDNHENHNKKPTAVASASTSAPQNNRNRKNNHNNNNSYQNYNSYRNNRNNNSNNKNNAR